MITEDKVIALNVPLLFPHMPSSYHHYFIILLIIKVVHGQGQKKVPPPFDRGKGRSAQKHTPSTQPDQLQKPLYRQAPLPSVK